MTALAREGSKPGGPSCSSADEVRGGHISAGGLISYGIDQANLCLRAASYLDRILKGSKPADLPVQQPTKFELVINLKAAKAIGLTIPESFLLHAEEVIE